MKPGNSAVEKELSQLHQSRDALNTALSLVNSGDFSKSLEYVDKVVLVFSPACSEVTIKTLTFVIPRECSLIHLSRHVYILTWSIIFSYY